MLCFVAVKNNNQVLSRDRYIDQSIPLDSNQKSINPFSLEWSLSPNLFSVPLQFHLIHFFHDAYVDLSCTYVTNRPSVSSHHLQLSYTFIPNFIFPHVHWSTIIFFILAPLILSYCWYLMPILILHCTTPLAVQ